MKHLIQKTIVSTVLVLMGSAAFAQNYIDRQGREWRRLAPVYNISVSSVVAVCSQNPCQGKAGTLDLTGWTWANSNEVLEVMREFEPNAPVLSSYYEAAAVNFFNAMGNTYQAVTSYQTVTSAHALTSSIDPANGKAIGASVDLATNSYGASFRFLTAENTVSYSRGVFVYRRSQGGSVPAPAPTPTPAPVAPKNCTISGKTVLHGSSIRMFKSSSVSRGSTCTSQLRYCTNGVLSGTYTALSCVVRR